MNLDIDLTTVRTNEINDYASYIRELSNYIHQTITSTDPSPANIQIAADDLAVTVKHYLLASYSR